MPGQSWACIRGISLVAHRGWDHGFAAEYPMSAKPHETWGGRSRMDVQSLTVLDGKLWIQKLHIETFPLHVQRNTLLVWQNKEKQKHNLEKITVLCHCFLMWRVPGGCACVCNWILTAKTKGAIVRYLKTSEVYGRLLLLFVSFGSGQGCQEFDTAEMIISRGYFWRNCTLGRQHLLCLVLTECHIRWMLSSLSSFWQAIKAN